MAAFTTIAAATIAIGGSVYKGAQASKASNAAAQKAGELYGEQKQLEQDAVARLETNYYDAVRATTDIYDRQLQTANAVSGQIIEAAAEGDQRGISATAGKVKQASDATTGAIADKYAAQKLAIDNNRAEASEKDASEIADLFDDRAAAAGVQADALTTQADDLKGQATNAYITAGASALSSSITAFGGGASRQGKTADAIAEKTGGDRGEILKSIQNGNFSGQELRQMGRSGDMLPINATPPTTIEAENNTSMINVPGLGSFNTSQLAAFTEQQNAIKAEEQAAKEYAAMSYFDKTMYDINKNASNWGNPYGTPQDAFKTR